MFSDPRTAFPFVPKLFLNALQNFWEPRGFQFINADPKCAKLSSSNYMALLWATQEAAKLPQTTTTEYLKIQKEKRKGGKPRGVGLMAPFSSETPSLCGLGVPDLELDTCTQHSNSLFQPVHFLFNHTIIPKEDMMETERTWQRRLRSTGHPGMLLTHFHSWINKQKKTTWYWNSRKLVSATLLQCSVVSC